MDHTKLDIFVSMPKHYNLTQHMDTYFLLSENVYVERSHVDFEINIIIFLNSLAVERKRTKEYIAATN